MLNKLIGKRNQILIIYVTILLAFLSVTLFFGSTEDKLQILILSVIIPFVIYAFTRLMYRVVSTTASPKAMRFFYHFFLASGLFGTLMFIIAFLSDPASGIPMPFGACGALVISTLDCAKKNI